MDKLLQDLMNDYMNYVEVDTQLAGMEKELQQLQQRIKRLHEQIKEKEDVLEKDYHDIWDRETNRTR